MLFYRSIQSFEIILNYDFHHLKLRQLFVWNLTFDIFYYN
jgi:hypothetical protein